MDQAVIKMFEENLLPYLRKFHTAHEFRQQKLYTEATDTALRANLSVI
jgi:hypothetical protein